ncbi:hypothetical protein BU14_0130s0014 [Porphyra umbilicalis]|uniref:Uncharacterized protein n=1 Tax=Porphyra umbilicalis TaxID=2786 RepID=A0A1X6PAC1_PORUM|nr:hypothetical protein BU14_0130s0014 [Porphyra umbilicalis]|eukprot:OSX77859.1 hypothetical protein BU14_0130s0014 [Porphyra umbilicalis]
MVLVDGRVTRAWSCSFPLSKQSEMAKSHVANSRVPRLPTVNCDGNLDEETPHMHVRAPPWSLPTRHTRWLLLHVYHGPSPRWSPPRCLPGEVPRVGIAFWAARHRLRPHPLDNPHPRSHAGADDHGAGCDLSRRYQLHFHPLHGRQRGPTMRPRDKRVDGVGRPRDGRLDRPVAPVGDRPREAEAAPHPYRRRAVKDTLHRARDAQADGNRGETGVLGRWRWHGAGSRGGGRGRRGWEKMSRGRASRAIERNRGRRGKEGVGRDGRREKRRGESDSNSVLDPGETRKDGRNERDAAQGGCRREAGRPSTFGWPEDHSRFPNPV